MIWTVHIFYKVQNFRDSVFCGWFILDCEKFVKNSGPLDLHFALLWASFLRSELFITSSSFKGQERLKSRIWGYDPSWIVRNLWTHGCWMYINSLVRRGEIENQWIVFHIRIISSWKFIHMWIIFIENKRPLVFKLLKLYTYGVVIIPSCFPVGNCSWSFGICFITGWIWNHPLLTLYFPVVARYSLRAKRVFSELSEKPFVVELDLRGTCSYNF